MNLRRVYADICRGYSVAEWRGSPVYIKHLTTFDQVDIDEVHDNALAEAIRRGVPTEEVSLKRLAARKLWVTKDQIALNQQRDYVKTLAITKTKLIFAAQIEAHTKTMVEEQLKLIEMMDHRANLIGLTAEIVADRRVQFTYLRQAFRRDETLKGHLFTEADMKRMDDETNEGLLDLYVGSINLFTTDALRRIAVADYFTNAFYLCGEDTLAFFGKPMCDLTAYQVSFLSHALYFKSIILNHNIPDDVRHEPDRLEEFVNRGVALNKVLAKADGARVGLVGTPEDFKALGLKDGTAEMHGIIDKGYKSGMEAASALGYKVG